MRSRAMWVGILILAAGMWGCGGVSEGSEQTDGRTGGQTPTTGGTEPGVGGTGVGGSGVEQGGAPIDGGAAGGGAFASARGASRVVPYSSGCGLGPYVIPSNGTPTSEQVVGDRITDGDTDDVDCSVTLSGGGYRIRLALEEEASSFALTANVAAQGDGYIGTGSAGFYDPSSGNISSNSCTVEVLATQEVGVGKAWGNFDCTDSAKEAMPGFSCNFAGSFLVENCN